MAYPGHKTSAGPFRSLAIYGTLVCLIGVAGFFLLRSQGSAPFVQPVSAPTPQAPIPQASTIQATAPQKTVPPAPVAPAAAAAVPTAMPPVAPVAPSFDIVRVSPQGNAVIAGRAEPGADVVLLDGTKEVARTQADRRGEFVVLPAAPLPEGGRSLTLAARGSSGPEVKSDGAVVVVVPPAAVAAVPQTTPAAPAMGPVAVLVPSAAPPRVLQDARRGSAALSLDVVDYDEKGAIRFTGAAPPGSTVRVYVDNAAAGDAVADAAGHWSLTPSGTVAPGLHSMRVDHLDAGGKVMARVELPFQRASIPVTELASGRVVVQPGQNLWRLARSAYGNGVRYTVIYLANREQIRDPNLIYPGQAFAVPASAP